MGSEAVGGCSPPLTYSTAPFFPPSSHHPPPQHPQRRPSFTHPSAAPSTPPPAYHDGHSALFLPSHHTPSAAPPHALRAASHPGVAFSSPPLPYHPHPFSLSPHSLMLSPSLSSATAPSTSSSSSSSSSSYPSSSPPLSSHQQSLYKTELCKSWTSSSMCRYGVKCKFAHGEHELVVVQRHRKYKTEKCRNFIQDGQCRYADRCKFIHEGEDAEGGFSRAGQGQPQSQLHLQQPLSQQLHHRVSYPQQQPRPFQPAPSAALASPSFYPSPGPRCASQPSARNVLVNGSDSQTAMPISFSLRSPHVLSAATSTPLMPPLGVNQQPQQLRPSPMLLSSNSHRSRSSSACSSLLGHDGGSAARWMNEGEEGKAEEEGDGCTPTAGASSTTALSSLLTTRTSPSLQLQLSSQQPPPYSSPSCHPSSSSSYPYSSPSLATSRAVGAPVMTISPQPHWLPASALSASFAPSAADYSSTEAAGLSSEEEGEAGESGQSLYHLQRSLFDGDAAREDASAFSSASAHFPSFRPSTTRGFSSSSSSPTALNAASPAFSPRPQRPPVRVDVNDGVRAPPLTALQALQAPTLSSRAGDERRAQAQEGSVPQASMFLRGEMELPSFARFRSQSVDQRRPSSASSSASSGSSIGGVYHSSRSPHAGLMDGSDSPEPLGMLDRSLTGPRGGGGGAGATSSGLQRGPTILPRPSSGVVNSEGAGASAAAYPASRLSILPVDTSSSASARAPHPGHAISPGTASSTSSVSPRISSGSPSFPAIPSATGVLPAFLSGWSDRSSSFSSAGAGDSTSTTRASSYVGSPLMLPQSPFTTSPASASHLAGHPGPPHLQLPRSAHRSPAISAASSASSSPNHPQYAAALRSRPHRRSADLTYATYEDKEREGEELSPLGDAASIAVQQQQQQQGGSWSNTQPRANRQPILRPLQSSSSSFSASSSTSSSPTASPFIGAALPSATPSPWQSAVRSSPHIIDDPQPQPQQQRLPSSTPSSSSSTALRNGAVVLLSPALPSSRRPPPVHTPSTASSSPSSAAASQPKRSSEADWRARPAV